MNLKHRRRRSSSAIGAVEGNGLPGPEEEDEAEEGRRGGVELPPAANPVADVYAMVDGLKEEVVDADIAAGMGGAERGG